MVKNTEIEEISKIDVVKKILSENNRLKLSDAIKMAKEIKTLDVKDPDNTWKWTFKNAAAFGLIKIETETFVELA